MFSSAILVSFFAVGQCEGIWDGSGEKIHDKRVKETGEELDRLRFGGLHFGGGDKRRALERKEEEARKQKEQKNIDRIAAEDEEDARKLREEGHKVRIEAAREVEAEKARKQAEAEAEKARNEEEARKRRGEGHKVRIEAAAKVEADEKARRAKDPPICHHMDETECSTPRWRSKCVELCRESGSSRGVLKQRSFLAIQ